MTTPELPDALRAAARDLLFAVNMRFADPISEKYRADKLAETQLLADAALAGFLAACEVREEWICTGEPGKGFPPYRFVWPMPGQSAEDARTKAIEFVAQVASRHDWDTGPVLHRRLVITTPTEERP